jgi:ABC-type sulfate transport system substrate-binding protein
VQKYLDDPQTISKLLKEADRIDKEARDREKTFVEKTLTDYIKSLDTETRARLRNLIDIE